MSDGDQARGAYEGALCKLTPAAQRQELQRLFLDMMDYTEQSDGENLYIELEKCLQELP